MATISWDRLRLETVLCDSSVYGVVWSGWYAGHRAAIKIVQVRHSDEAETQPLRLESPRSPLLDQLEISFHEARRTKTPMSASAFQMEVDATIDLAKDHLAPRVYAYEIRSSYAIVIMARIDTDVKSILQRRDLCPTEIRRIDQAIRRFHRHRIHGDMKPSNLGAHLNSSGHIDRIYFLDCGRIQRIDESKSSREWDRYRRHDIDVFRRHQQLNRGSR